MMVMRCDECCFKKSCGNTVWDIRKRVLSVIGLISIVITVIWLSMIYFSRGHFDTFVFELFEVSQFWDILMTPIFAIVIATSFLYILAGMMCASNVLHHSFMTSIIFSIMFTYLNQSIISGLVVYVITFAMSVVLFFIVELMMNFIFDLFK